jgi:hypothetical protein
VLDDVEVVVTVVEDIVVVDAVENTKPAKLTVPPGAVTLIDPLLPPPTTAVIW